MSALAFPLTRRRFLHAAGVGAAGALAGAAGARALGAQQPADTAVEHGEPSKPDVQVAGADMSGGGYRPVVLPPRPGASPSMTDLERDALERRLSCPCPCTLDVFTCRTSMPCGFAPQMHTDVMRAIAGGHTADEILAAFVGVYGEQVRMAPKPEGFNLMGYLMPFAAIGGGGLAIAVLLRRWQRQGDAHRAAAAAAPAPAVPVADAHPDELARIERAVRGDGE